MDITTWLIIGVVSMLLSALFSGCEMAYVTSDRVRVEIDVKQGGIIARIIDRFYANSEFFISSILVGNNIVLVVYGMAAAALLEPVLEQWISNEALILIAQTLISTGVILLAGEFIPKTIFGINPNRSLKVFALPIYIFYIILYPLSLFSTWLSRCLMKVLGVKGSATGLRAISIGDLNDYLEETIDTMEEQKTRVENEVKIFHNALDFSSTHLRDCMIPRNEIVAVNIDTATRESLSEMFTRTGRSKIIVYRDDIDTILGYIHVRELFEPDSEWRDHIMPVLYAPENLLAKKMMRRMLQQKRSVAIVIDEFGGTAGLITLEDLVEEIFGDIQDEHDTTKLTGKVIAPGIFEFSGRSEIAEINEQFNLDLPEDDAYQTLAGYILHSTGTIPAEGDTVMIEELRFDILKKSANRLELIRLTLPVEE
ncbi:MAG: hemolysin family protein [Muribaculaceae bacterium]|nr:hemolysin family protein [Muribaculaceae bacterium]MDE6704057.1 hemolysin family protein [Muribaculaceae bacterium]